MVKRIAGFFAGLGRYELIAFVTGFVLMAYELIASRLLAPSIGSSTYVWTSVIGIMIAALALGYAFGGWLADKRVAVQDVAYLLLFSAVMMTVSLISYDSVIAVITHFISDSRIQGVVAAITLFMPTSFLLGVISPYLARLRVKSVATAGRSVASLSALNSLGGISGTFVTGFILFSFIGSRESLAMLIVSLMVCSWLLVPRAQRAGRAVASGVLLVVLAMEFVPPAHAATVTNIDTPTGHYQVEKGTYEGHDVKVLVTGPSGVQSGIFTDGSRELVFPYTRMMADVVAQAPHKERILMLGGGVFTLPEHLAIMHPSSQIDVVEIDPQLEQVAKDYFGYTAPANVRSIAADARAYVQQAAQKYDIILIDVFNEQTTPFSLTTREFAGALKNILQSDGVIVVNIIGGLSEACKPLLTSLDASYRSAFISGLVLPISEETLQRRQNVIGVYGSGSLSWLDAERAWASLPQDRVITLTDNFAPVESLAQRCR